ncbi:C39 family peptidase [uncultured Sphingomonas sp.]|uniref:C39 family peptidase n=1 Tax=uncultured Sphingomonas sp. TaxID=158754 RepID=UPI0035CB631F
MKPAGGLLAAALLAGCAAQSHGGDPQFLSSSGSMSDFRVPVASMLARKFNTVVRQQYDFSCGSAALATLLLYHYELPRSEADVFTGMWRKGDQPRIRQVGFSLLDMKRYLVDNALKGDGYRVSLDSIAERGLPGIALITVKGYRHFIVVKGVTADRVLIGDPSLGLRSMSRNEFQQIWNGIYFVLTTSLDVGQRNFNGQRQWRAIARAPVGGPFVDPLSPAALALTAPFYRDF